MWKMEIVLWVLAALNFAGLVLCGADKWKAKHHKWRIPEKTLFGAALMGGGFGVWGGMNLFRHKTKHWYFVIGVPAITLFEYGLAVWLLLRQGVN